MMNAQLLDQSSDYSVELNELISPPVEIPATLSEMYLAHRVIRSNFHGSGCYHCSPIQIQERVAPFDAKTNHWYAAGLFKSLTKQ